MFKFRSLAALGLIAVALNVVAAQGDATTDPQKAPPKPVDNKMYDAMVGTWQANVVDMMGEKMTDVLKVHWALNRKRSINPIYSIKN